MSRFSVRTYARAAAVQSCQCLLCSLKYRTQKYSSQIIVFMFMQMVISEVHLVCHNIANGIKRGSNSKKTDELKSCMLERKVIYAAEYLIKFVMSFECYFKHFLC